MRPLLLIYTLTCISYHAFTQVTLIPNSSFEQELIDQGYDTGPIDGFVYTDSINTISAFSIYNTTATDLTGIEDFSNLTELYCFDNQLTSLDVSQNNLLTVLDCRFNNLICLNVKNDNNSNFTLFETIPNLELTCIEVDNEAWSNSNWSTEVGINTQFSISCGNNCSSLNLKENSLSTVNLFPNPASDNVHIDLTGVQSEGKIILINNLGQVINAEKISPNKLTAISLNHLEIGVYYLKLEIISGASKIFKIIKHQQ